MVVPAWDTPRLQRRYAASTLVVVAPSGVTELSVLGLGFQSLKRICSPSGTALTAWNWMSAAVGTNVVPTGPVSTQPPPMPPVPPPLELAALAVDDELAAPPVDPE